MLRMQGTDNMRRRDQNSFSLKLRYLYPSCPNILDSLIYQLRADESRDGSNYFKPCVVIHYKNLQNEIGWLIFHNPFFDIFKLKWKYFYNCVSFYFYL